MKDALKLAETVEAGGRVTYQEASRAFNTIKIPRVIVDQFPDLRNKSLMPSFKMKLYKNYADLKRLIWDMEYSKEQVPIILVFYNKNGT